MEIAVAAIALITLFCGRSVCLADPQPKLKLTAKKAKHLDEMREYMEYLVLEEQLKKAQHSQAYSKASHR